MTATAASDMAGSGCAVGTTVTMVRVRKQQRRITTTLWKVRGSDVRWEKDDDREGGLEGNARRKAPTGPLNHDDGGQSPAWLKALQPSTPRIEI